LMELAPQVTSCTLLHYFFTPLPRSPLLAPSHPFTPSYSLTPRRPPRHASESTQMKAKNGLEKYVMTKLYTVAFDDPGEWPPSVVSAASVLDPYIASLALTYCDHFAHLDPIHQGCTSTRTRRRTEGSWRAGCGSFSSSSRITSTSSRRSATRWYGRYSTPCTMHTVLIHYAHPQPR
jgi:hypothetical protein